MKKLDASDLATILSALRLFQKTYQDKDADTIFRDWPEHFLGRNGLRIPPLGTDDIDELCERINQ